MKKSKQKSQKRIEVFKDEYFFLSNFYPAEVKIFGRKWHTSEHAYQSQKSDDKIYQDKIHKAITASASKKIARQLERSGKRKEDWDDIKYDIMYDVVLAKFKQNKKLRKALLATGKAKLIEGNWWKDTTWGVCDGIGKNWLGKILMKVRKKLK